MQISDQMVEDAYRAAVARLSSMAPSKGAIACILEAALAGHVVVPKSIFDELKRRDDTISKIGPRGEQLTESVRANECSSAWSLVSAMISAAPAQREG